MTTADIRTGASIGRGLLAAFLGAALLCGAAPALHAESVEELTAQLAEEEKAAPESLNVANVLGRLADAHRAAGELDKAEPLYQRAIAIYEKQEGAEALGVAVLANNLAQAYTDQKQYDKAESFYQRALAICEKIQPEHADTATVANNLGMFYQQQNKPDQAEAMYRRALAIREKALGADSAETAAVVRNLVELYKAQGEEAQIALLRYDFPNAVEAAEQPAKSEATDMEAAVDGSPAATDEAVAGVFDEANEDEATEADEFEQDMADDAEAAEANEEN